MQKSEGHIGTIFNGTYEVFEQEGQVFLAPVGNSFDIDGYRHGRWECSRSHFDRNISLYTLDSERA